MVRRLPVYILADCSGSMAGDPIEQVKQGIRALHANLMGDPSAVETAFLSVITFDSSARQVVPLTEVAQFQAPDLQASGTTALGAALEILCDRLETEVRKTSGEMKGDWKPLVFLLTDGSPTDDWKPHADRLKQNKPSPANIIAVACGSKADVNVLKQIASTVLEMRDGSRGICAVFQMGFRLGLTDQRESGGLCRDGRRRDHIAAPAPRRLRSSRSTAPARWSRPAIPHPPRLPRSRKPRMASRPTIRLSPWLRRSLRRIPARPVRNRRSHRQPSRRKQRLGRKRNPANGSPRPCCRTWRPSRNIATKIPCSAKPPPAPAGKFSQPRAAVACTRTVANIGKTPWVLPVAATLSRCVCRMAPALIPLAGLAPRSLAERWLHRWKKPSRKARAICQISTGKP